MSRPANLIDHLGPIESCPGCGGQEFQVEDNGANVVFRCLSCAVSWRYELGYVWRVPEYAPGLR